MVRTLTVTLLLAALLSWPGSAPAQEEMSSGLYKYRDTEVSGGSYESYEVRPGRAGPPLINDLPRPNALYSRQTAQRPLDMRFMEDAHRGLKDYRFRSCADAACHPGKDRSLHTVRQNISCRQCHGGEPIATINQYHSLMNPIRRHAYVCAKCHQGAGANFATYVIHEPNPASAATLVSFPALSWAFWTMIAIAAITFALFLPHTVLWGLRELLSGSNKGGADDN